MIPQEEWEAERKKAAEDAAKEEKLERDKVEVGTWFSNPAAAQQQINLTNPAKDAAPVQQPQRSGVGKYLQAAMLKGGAAGGEEQPAAKKPKTAGGGFGNFDNW